MSNSADKGQNHEHPQHPVHPEHPDTPVGHVKTPRAFGGLLVLKKEQP
jgi:hypothetical protein